MFKLFLQSVFMGAQLRCAKVINLNNITKKKWGSLSAAPNFY